MKPLALLVAAALVLWAAVYRETLFAGAFGILAAVVG